MVMDIYAGLAFCALGAITFAALYSAYFFLPYKEVRRRGSRGAEVYKRLSLVSRHGKLAKGFFRLVTYIFAVVTVMLLSREFDALRAFVLVSMFALVLLYLKKTTIKSAARLAAWAAPFFDWIFTKARPVADILGRIPLRRRSEIRTDIFTKEDLIEFLETQRSAKNNRIDTGDLEHALHALAVRVKKVKDHMVKFKDIHMVNIKEPIGPILLSELHKTGFNLFPVQGNARHEVLGILSLKKLKEHASGGVVADAMDEQVFYVHEDYRLEQVLQAYTKTGKSMFIVIDAREKVTGLITVSDVLKELAGEANVYSEFDDYDNPSAVAQR